MNINPKLYDKYSQNQIDEAIDLLTYKNASTLPKFESDVYPTLYIFRHGQTEDNANFLFSGWHDSPLTEKGRQQAQELAEKLKNKKLDMLFSSPLIRAVDTMKIAVSLNDKARELEIKTDKRIIERNYGDYVGTSKLEMQLADAKLAHLVRRSYDQVPPNGESLSMVCMRVRDFCESIIPTMKKYNINIAVSCHGNSIRGFRRYFEQLSDEETATLETPLAQDYAAYIIN
jgi:2,3-bisphosphoglycerate-dependent phosphoglycerate mutase